MVSASATSLWKRLYVVRQKKKSSERRWRREGFGGQDVRGKETERLGRCDRGKEGSKDGQPGRKNNCCPETDLEKGLLAMTSFRETGKEGKSSENTPGVLKTCSLLPKTKKREEAYLLCLQRKTRGRERKKARARGTLADLDAGREGSGRV